MTLNPKVILLILFVFLSSCGRKAPPIPLDRSVPEAPKVSATVEGKAIGLLVELPTKTRAGSYLTNIKALVIERREVSFDVQDKREVKRTIELKPKLHSAANLYYFLDEKVLPGKLYLYKAKVVKDFLVESPFSEEIRVYFRYPPKAPTNLRVVEVSSFQFILIFDPPAEDLGGRPLELPLEFGLERLRDGKTTSINLKNKTEFLFIKESPLKECYRVRASFRYFETLIFGPFSKELCL